MKRIRKMLMGIAISVFGCAVACTDVLIWFGWGISFVGLVYTWIGYYWDNDED